MAVTEEDVRRAYYASAGAPQSWWITELQMEPPALIVADEASGKIYRVPYEIEGAAVSFGNADEVASYSDVAAARGTGPVVVYASAEESRSVEIDAAGWDGAAAQTGLGDDPSPGAIKAMYALPGDTKTGSSLPHHEVSDGKVGAANPVACTAAIAAINGARGGLKGRSPAELKTAYGHLAAHLRSMGQNPPDFNAAALGDDEAGLAARLDRLRGIAAAAQGAVAAADADADDDVKHLVASLDATLDQASQLSASVDRSKVDEPTGQALDLITAAEAIADQLMDMLGIYDPDDADDDSNESADTSAAADTTDGAGDAGSAPVHGAFSGDHSHPHPAFGSQGGDATHEHVHSHDNNATHDHAHDTQAAAQPAAASTETGGDSGMGFEFTTEQMAAIRQRLGKKDGEPVTADDIAATMETPRAPAVAAAAGDSGTPEVTVPQIGDGTYLVDGEILRGYQDRAVAGDRAVHALHLAERDTIIAAAIGDGKFAQSRKEHFESLWAKDPEGTRSLVASLAPGLIPMGGPMGSSGDFSGDPDMPGDFEAQRAYLDLYPEDRKGGITPAPGVRAAR